MANKLSKLVSKVYKLPQSTHEFLLTKLFTSQVKFAATAKLKVNQIRNQEVVVTLANKKRVQNHIGGIHAVGAALAADLGVMIDAQLHTDASATIGIVQRQGLVPLLKHGQVK